MKISIFVFPTRKISRCRFPTRKSSKCIFTDSESFRVQFHNSEILQVYFHWLGKFPSAVSQLGNPPSVFPLTRKISECRFTTRKFSECISTDSENFRVPLHNSEILRLCFDWLGKFPSPIILTRNSKCEFSDSDFRVLICWLGNSFRVLLCWLGNTRKISGFPSIKKNSGPSQRWKTITHIFVNPTPYHNLR